MSNWIAAGTCRSMETIAVGSETSDVTGGPFACQAKAAPSSAATSRAIRRSTPCAMCR